MEQQRDTLTIHRIEVLHPQCPYRSPDFRTGYFTIVLIESGGGRFFVDDKAFPTFDATVYVTNPGPINGFEILRPTTGFVITFEHSFLRERIHADALLDFSFLIDKLKPPQAVARTQFLALQRVAREIMEETQSAEPSRAIIGHLLGVLLYRLQKVFLSPTQQETERPAQIVAAFRKLLGQAIIEMVASREHPVPKVRDLARKLGVHPDHLSNVLREHTGRNARDWIHERRMTEAQALLARTSSTIQEIAFILGFQEPSHFSRAFSRSCGMTPTAYRRSLKFKA